MAEASEVGSLVDYVLMAVRGLLYGASAYFGVAIAEKILDLMALGLIG